MPLHPLVLESVRAIRRVVLPLRGALALGAALGFLSLEPALADPIVVTTSGVNLDRRDATRQSLGPLNYLGGLRLRSPNRRFGGLSGIEVSPDGKSMLAISDRGFWFSADLMYDPDGRLIGLPVGLGVPD